jgi:thiamine-monophosphate kinase
LLETTTIGELGEFALLDAIRQQLGRDGVAHSPSLVLGSGDDAAIVSPPAGRELVWTCDIQIAGRHFLPDVLSAEEIGHRAMQVCLSDLASMGAIPLVALVSLGLPAEMLVSVVLSFHAGFAQALRPHAAAVAGGNISRSWEASGPDAP